MPKIISSSRGNVIVLVLGLIAVVGAIALEIRNRQIATVQRGHQSALTSEADLIMHAFAARLQNPETCTAALAGEVIKPGTMSPIVLHYVLDETLTSAGKTLGAGAQVTKGVTLASLQIDTPTLEDMRTEILDSQGVPIELVRYPARLQAAFSDASGARVSINRIARARADGSQDLDHGVPIYIWLTAGDGQIISCFGRNSAGTMCNELGGYFVPNTKPYHLSCRQSFKTQRRKDGVLTAAGSCRIGGILSKSKGCSQRYGVPFSYDLLQQPHPLLEPTMAHSYLCLLCQ